MEKNNSEIKEIKKKIKECYDVENRRKFQIFKSCLILCGPVIISTACVCGAYKLMNISPLKLEEVKYVNNIKKEVSYNSFSVENNYIRSNEETISTFKIYNQAYTLNSKYYRKVETFKILNNEEVFNAIRINENIELFKEMGIKIDEQIEEVIKEDINSYVTAVIYDKDKNDYIFIKETFNENLEEVIIGLLVIMMSIFISNNLKRIQGKSIKKEIKNINLNYKQPYDVELLKKQLKTKKLIKELHNLRDKNKI